MQFAKDSFFLALQERLASVNPERTVMVNGSTVPGVVTPENLPPSTAEPLPNAFYVEWGVAKVVDGYAGTGALMSLDCTISYYTFGTAQSMVDRGRILGQLDGELLSICQPSSTEKRDYTQAPSADLGTRVFWSRPVLEKESKGGVAGDGEGHADGRAQHRARLTVFFFTEVTLS